MMFGQSSRLAWCFCSVLAWISLSVTAPAAALKTQNVFLIISDGLRWQEVFNGADELLMNKENGGVADTNALRRAYWRATPESRRSALLPFVWTEISRHGQLFGNQAKGSVVSVTNGKNFSYPGYNEIITGSGDPRVDSNDKRLNPNQNVFEWLDRSAGLKGRVAVFGTWDLFPYIFNVERSHLPIWPGWEPRFAQWEIPAPSYLTELRLQTPPMWQDLTWDSFLFHAVRDYVKRCRPRVLFVGFGETDEWAHAGRYDQYLDAAHRFDEFVRDLWAMAQSMRQYRGKTTFILAADHGRGHGPTEWKSHGEKVAGAEGDWIAVIGPDTPALGERGQTQPVTASQIAGTIAALLGQDYHRATPGSGVPIADVIGASADHPSVAGSN
jgi:hypothetical protein